LGGVTQRHRPVSSAGGSPGVSWRLIFLVNLPLIAVVVTIALRPRPRNA